MEAGKLAAEMGHSRRALREIKNLTVAPPPYPCAAVIKRGFTKYFLKPKSSCSDIDRSQGQNRAISPRIHFYILFAKIFCSWVVTTPCLNQFRRFAASLANKKQQPQWDSNLRNELVDNEKHKKPMPLDTVSNSSDDFSIIDLDDDDDGDMEANELPAYVKQTEAILEEMDKCDVEEAEMEDAALDPMLDIDSCDANNPLAVVDYVEDIYAFYRQEEVHYKFELMDETLYLAVNLIDRFLERQPIIRKKLQLVGVTAMLLACKYEEVSVPVVEDLILISDKAYTREEVLEMEKLMINTLQFKMSVPTPYVFMRRFLKATQNEDRKLELLSFFLVELCLVEYEMLKFQPSLLAAAAIYTAQCTLRGLKHWTRTSEWHTCYTEKDLLLMVDFHQKAGVGKLTGVHRKYSTFQLGFVSRVEPARFLFQAARF
ncbi:hypothetical protein ACLOJK_018307 [Asimina triloba]